MMFCHFLYAVRSKKNPPGNRMLPGVRSSAWRPAVLGGDRLRRLSVADSRKADEERDLAEELPCLSLQLQLGGRQRALPLDPVADRGDDDASEVVAQEEVLLVHILQRLEVAGAVGDHFARLLEGHRLISPHLLHRGICENVATFAHHEHVEPVHARNAPDDFVHLLRVRPLVHEVEAGVVRHAAKGHFLDSKHAGQPREEACAADHRIQLHIACRDDERRQLPNVFVIEVVRQARPAAAREPGRAERLEQEHGDRDDARGVDQRLHVLGALALQPIALNEAPHRESGEDESKRPVDEALVDTESAGNQFCQLIHYFLPFRLRCTAYKPTYWAYAQHVYHFFKYSQYFYLLSVKMYCIVSHVGSSHIYEVNADREGYRT